MKTFEELVAKSIECAEAAEEQLAAAHGAGTDPDADPASPGLWSAIQVAQSQAGTFAALAEAYARLASAVIVNRTSLHTASEQARGPRPS